MEIIRVGVLAAIYYMIIIVAYLFISGPFATIMTTFEDIDIEASDAEIESTSALARTSFNIFFAGLALIPPLWIAVYLLRREPHWGY